MRACPIHLSTCSVVWERSEEHTSELQSQSNLVCRLLLEKKKEKCFHHTLLPTKCSANSHFYLAVPFHLLYIIIYRYATSLVTFCGVSYPVSRRIDIYGMP